MPCLPTHQHTHGLISILHTQHPPGSSRQRWPDNDGSGGGTASRVVRPATQCRSHARGAYSQQRCADHKSLIHISPSSLTKDPHIDPSNMQSWVCTEATSECYPTLKYKPVWQEVQLSQRDRAAGYVIVFAKSRRQEVGDNTSILQTL